MPLNEVMALPMALLSIFLTPCRPCSRPNVRDCDRVFWRWLLPRRAAGKVWAIVQTGEIRFVIVCERKWPAANGAIVWPIAENFASLHHHISLKRTVGLDAIGIYAVVSHV